MTGNTYSLPRCLLDCFWKLTAKSFPTTWALIRSPTYDISLQEQWLCPGHSGAVISNSTHPLSYSDLLCSWVSWQRSMMIYVSPHVTVQQCLTPIISYFSGWVTSLVTLMGSDQASNLIVFDMIRLSGPKQTEYYTLRTLGTFLIACDSAQGHCSPYYMSCTTFCMKKIPTYFPHPFFFFFLSSSSPHPSEQWLATL